MTPALRTMPTDNGAIGIDPPALASPLDTARIQLESKDPRQRLEALTTLIAFTCESKPNQQAVGSFLRGIARHDATTLDRAKPRQLLQIVLSELQATDRTLRCAAARLICVLAYENLINQESIMQHSGGITIGWLHVFSAPRYQSSNTEMNRSQRQRARLAFLQGTQYASVYEEISEYYDTGCESYLPMCWSSPRPATADGDDEEDAVPDPAEHMLGFYLVPRQIQFRESDEHCCDDLLHSMDTADREVIENVKRAFDKVAAIHRLSKTVPASAFIQHCGVQKEATQLGWLLGDDIPHKVASLGAYFDSTSDSKDAQLSWSQILVYCTLRINTAHLHDAFGGSTLHDLADAFLKLCFSTSATVSTDTWVWLPVFINRITQSSTLTEKLKRQLRSLQRDVQLTPTTQPWRVLVRLQPEQITPVTWAVFLSQWRDAFELERRLGEQNAPPPRRTSVCSISSLRKSTVEQVHPNSYRDLDQLRRQLPAAYRSASQQSLPIRSVRSLTSFREELDATDNATNADELEENHQHEPEITGDESSLEYNLALFHRMQQSLSELDAIGRQRLESKQREKARVLDTVATNKEVAELARENRRQQLEEKEVETLTKLAELEHCKAARRAVLHERQQRRHDQAARRKRQHEEELEAKKQEITDKLKQRELVGRPHTDRSERPTPPTRPETPQPTMPSAPTQPRRPQSARASRPTTRSTDADLSPEMLRQRALLYGQVVSKIYTAGAAARSPTEKPEFQPHHVTRSFSVFSTGGFNVKAPVMKYSPRVVKTRAPRARQLAVAKEIEAGTVSIDGLDDREDEDKDAEAAAGESPARRRRERLAKASAAATKTTERPPQLSHAQGNACSTLVMRNAALTVSERIRIPDIPAPAVEDPKLPPYVIAAQYESLDDVHKRNFRERFNLKCVSHRLSYAVLKQYTKMVRRETAWQAFHDKCSGSGNSERIKHLDFVAVAQTLGVALSDKKLLVIARQLDRKKNGHIEWKAFYTWWSMQYNDHPK